MRVVRWRKADTGVESFTITATGVYFPVGKTDSSFKLKLSMAAGGQTAGVDTVRDATGTRTGYGALNVSGTTETKLGAVISLATGIIVTSISGTLTPILDDETAITTWPDILGSFPATEDANAYVHGSVPPVGLLATIAGTLVRYGGAGVGWVALGGASNTAQAALYGSDQIIQIVGDSTGANDYTWSGLLAQHLAKKSRVEYHRLVDNADPALVSYGVPSVYGGGTRRGVTPITRGRHQSTSEIGSWGSSIDVRVFANVSNWGLGSQQCFLARWGATSYSFNFYCHFGTLRLGLVQSGTLVGETKQSTANVPFANGTDGWVRFTWDAAELKFYVSTNGDTWTQLGAAITTTTTDINKDSLCDYSIGSMAGVDAGGAGASQMLGGTIYSAAIHDGINGPEITQFGIESWVESNIGGSSLVGSPTVRILNGSISGATLAYLAPRLSRIVKINPKGRGAFIVNAGKNESTGRTFASDMATAIAAIKARFAGIGYIKNQYPTVAPGNFPQEMAQKSIICAYIANEVRCKLIDTYTNFIAQPNYPALLEVDGVHATSAGCLIDVLPVIAAVA